MISLMKMENYKCFVEEDIEFSNLTILAGANAAGKSSIIQALLLSHHCLKSKENVIDVSKILGIEAGAPQALVAQNLKELKDADFRLSLANGEKLSQINYKINKAEPLKLLFEKNEVDAKDSLFYLNAERMGPRMWCDSDVGKNEKVLVGHIGDHPY